MRTPWQEVVSDLLFRDRSNTLVALSQLFAAECEEHLAARELEVPYCNRTALLHEMRVRVRKQVSRRPPPERPVRICPRQQ